MSRNFTLKTSEERFGHGIYAANELAEKIYEYAKEYSDWYEFQDNELYPGSNYDNVLSDVRNGRTDGIKTFLREMINEYPGTIQSFKAETLINDIDSFESNHMSVSDTMQMPGIRM